MSWEGKSIGAQKTRGACGIETWSGKRQRLPFGIISRLATHVTSSLRRMNTHAESTPALRRM